MQDIFTQLHLLIADVEAGRFMDALDRFYTVDAVTHEPAAAPVSGKAALLNKEKAFLATVAEWHRIEAVHALVTDACTAIHWRFELTRVSGTRVIVEEVALQEWREEAGMPKIVTEKYFPLPPVTVSRDV